MASAATEATELRRAVGLRIGEIRRSRGLTQEDAAERLGMLTPNYARIEQGRQNVTLDTIVRIAVALDVAVVSFFRKPRRRQAKRGRPKSTRANAKQSTSRA